MAKNSVRDFDATAANNTDIQSVDIAENCAPSGINNAIRELMADIKDVSAGTVALESPQADSLTVTGDLTVDTNTLFVDSTNNNVLVGKTSSGIGTTGIELQGSNNRIFVTRSGDSTLYLNRTISDGSIQEFLKDGTTVGAIGSRGSGTSFITLKTTSGSGAGLTGSDNRILPMDESALADNNTDLGMSSYRFKDLYLGGRARAGGSTGSPAFSHHTDTDTGMNPDGSGNIQFTTQGSERMRIDSSGNVGIGTSSPSSYYSGNLVVKCGASEGGITIASNATTDTNYLMFADGTSGTARYRGYLGFTHNSPENMQVVTYGYIRFYTGDPTGERMRIDTSGNLLVGTTSSTGSGASSGKQVIQFAGATENGLYMDDTRTASGASNAVIFGRGATYVGKIETTTAPATNYISASDQRLKENIADADDAGSKIDAIQVRKYDWIGDGTHQDYGLVAQELQPIAPLAVSGDPNSDEMMGVDYSKLVPMLIKEIQSLRQRITDLENA